MIKTILIKKPDIKALKLQSETLQKIISPMESQGSDYIDPDEILGLEGLVNLIDHITDIAEGADVVFKSSEQAKIGGEIATLFDLDENEKGRFDTKGGDFTPLGLYRLCKRAVMGEL